MLYIKGKYEPNRKERPRYKRTLVPGEKCRRCKRRKEAVLAATSNLRQEILDSYERYEGKRRGLTVGLVFDKVVHWREVFIIKKRPVKFFSYDLDVESTRRVFDDTLGTFSAPSRASYDLSGLARGVPLCILDFCSDRGSFPDFCIFAPKRGMESSPDGWSIIFDEPVLCKRIAQKDRGVKMWFVLFINGRSVCVRKYCGF